MSWVAARRLGSAFLWLAVCLPVSSRVQAVTWVYAANTASGTVSVIDADRNDVVRTLLVEGLPRDLAVGQNGTRLYVATQHLDQLFVIDAVTGQGLDVIELGGEPEAIALRPDGAALYVTGNAVNTVSIVELATGAVTIIDVGNAPVGVDVSSDSLVDLLGGSKVRLAKNAVLGGRERSPDR